MLVAVWCNQPCHPVRAVVDRAAEERMLGLLAERARKFQQEKEEVGGWHKLCMGCAGQLRAQIAHSNGSSGRVPRSGLRAGQVCLQGSVQSQ